MPFGINLGPLSVMRQDKSSKKLLKNQQRQEMVDMLDGWTEKREAKAADRLHRQLVELKGTEQATADLTELERLRGVSRVLAEQFEEQLRSEVDSQAETLQAGRAEDLQSKVDAQRAAMADTRETKKLVKQLVAEGNGDYDTLFAIYIEIARQHTSNYSYTADAYVGFNRTAARAQSDAWKQAKQERS